MAHRGLYRCEASNQLGADRSQAMLTVQSSEPHIVEEYYESNVGIRCVGGGTIHLHEVISENKD